MEVIKIIGAPGTGKTETLAGITEKEINSGVRPDRIALLSFTKKGAEQLLNRLIGIDGSKKYKYAVSDFPYCRTIHSLAFIIAGCCKSNVVSDHHYKDLSSAIGIELSGSYGDDYAKEDDIYLFAENLERNNKRKSAELLQTLDAIKYDMIKTNYRKYKDKYGLYDFTDMIELAMKQEPLDVDVAIIDEAQDLTTLQYNFIQHIFSRAKKIYFAGDDDQAIYSWAGADVDYFINLPAKHITLEQSHRLPLAVHDYAMAVSGMIGNRLPKIFKPRIEGGAVKVIYDLSQVEFKQGESYLFLAHNIYFLKKMDAWLREQGFIFENRYGLSVNKTLLDDIKLHDKKRSGELKTVRSMVQHTGSNKEPDFKYPWYTEFKKYKPYELAYYKRVLSANLPIYNIKTSTIHGAKGGEADNVILSLDFTSAVEREKELSPDDINRVLYTGITRAKKNLYFIQYSDRRGHPILQTKYLQ